MCAPNGTRKKAPTGQWELRSYFSFFLPLTGSLNAALALKTGNFAAGIWIGYPSAGCGPCERRKPPVCSASAKVSSGIGHLNNIWILINEWT